MIKENNYYTSYFTMEGLTAWIKTGEYKNTMNEIKEVITELVITKEDNRKDIVYKHISYNGFISYYWSKDGFSLSDVIEELLIYIAHNNIDKYWKDQFIDSVINNQFKGLNAIKRFKKEYELKLAVKGAIEELKKDQSNEMFYGAFITATINRLKEEFNISKDEIFQYRFSFK